MRRLNPEFVRNVWLELTPQRLVAMPLVIAALLVLAGAGLDRSAVPYAALGLFVLITVLWGTRLADGALTEEAGQGTWDAQRLSALTPWQLTIGKLFGGPIYAWYGGAFCAFAYVAFAPAQATADACRLLLGLVFAAIAAHAFVLALGLVRWRRTGPGPRVARGAGLALVPLALLVFRGLPTRRTGCAPDQWPGAVAACGEVHWYGRVFEAQTFAVLCAGLAATWMVLGLHQAMRRELALRDPPWLGIAFALFLDTFSGGWFYGSGALPRALHWAPALAHLGVCGVLLLILLYVQLFAEYQDWSRLKRLVARARAGDWREAAASLPTWLALLALGVLTDLAFSAAALVWPPDKGAIPVCLMALTLLPLALRDCAIVVGTRLSPGSRRTEAAAIFYLAILYLLVPLLLRVLGWGRIVPAFLPQEAWGSGWWLGVVAVEASFALGYAGWRWRRLAIPALPTAAGR